MYTQSNGHVISLGLLCSQFLSDCNFLLFPFKGDRFGNSLLCLASLIFKGNSDICGSALSRHKWHCKGKGESKGFSWNAARNHPSLKSKSSLARLSTHSLALLSVFPPAATKCWKAQTGARRSSLYFPSRLRDLTINNSHADSHFLFVHWRRRKIPYVHLTHADAHQVRVPGKFFPIAFFSYRDLYMCTIGQESGAAAVWKCARRGGGFREAKAK